MATHDPDSFDRLVQSLEAVASLTMDFSSKSKHAQAQKSVNKPNDK